MFCLTNISCEISARWETFFFFVLSSTSEKMDAETSRRSVSTFLDNLEYGINIYKTHEMETLENLEYGSIPIKNVRWSFCNMESLSFNKHEWTFNDMGSLSSENMNWFLDLWNFETKKLWNQETKKPRNQDIFSFHLRGSPHPELTDSQPCTNSCGAWWGDYA